MDKSRIYDIIIAGAGIVGLSTAYSLLSENPGIKILVLEKENDVAKHQTGNNSGVIHSGIYYKPGSLKAVNCREGYNLLLDFCDNHKIDYQICGKIIVAVDERQIPYLETLYKRGLENGLTGLEFIPGELIKKYEPEVDGVKAVYVPQTGIINYKNVCRKLKEIIVTEGSDIEFNNEVKSIDQGVIITVSTKNNKFQCRGFVNCCGLQSDRIAAITEKNLNVRIIPFRGEYYNLNTNSEHKVKNLVYPVPDPAFPFLGVHFTRMIDGGVEAGPNAVLALKREGYTKVSVNLKDIMDIIGWSGFRKVAGRYLKMGLMEQYRSFNKFAFTKALNKLIPSVKFSDLKPGGAGVRAQACDKEGNLLDDFYFLENKNILHVCNAPSPAATASLAIGRKIADKIIRNLN